MEAGAGESSPYACSKIPAMASRQRAELTEKQRRHCGVLKRRACVQTYGR